MLETLLDQEIDVCKDNEVIKTIRRNIRRDDVYYPNRGKVEVQKQKWCQVVLVLYHKAPRWKLHLEDNKFIDMSFVIKK
jgi:hypothetical protein